MQATFSVKTLIQKRQQKTLWKIPRCSQVCYAHITSSLHLITSFKCRSLQCVIVQAFLWYLARVPHFGSYLVIKAMEQVYFLVTQPDPHSSGERPECKIIITLQFQNTDSVLLWTSSGYSKAHSIKSVVKTGNSENFYFLFKTETGRKKWAPSLVAKRFLVCCSFLGFPNREPQGDRESCIPLPGLAAKQRPEEEPKGCIFRSIGFCLVERGNFAHFISLQCQTC